MEEEINNLGEGEAIILATSHLPHAISVSVAGKINGKIHKTTLNFSKNATDEAIQEHIKRWMSNIKEETRDLSSLHGKKIKL